jgi:hypothetical protein
MSSISFGNICYLQQSVSINATLFHDSNAYRWRAQSGESNFHKTNFGFWNQSLELDKASNFYLHPSMNLMFTIGWLMRHIEKISAPWINRCENI